MQPDPLTPAQRKAVARLVRAQERVVAAQAARGQAVLAVMDTGLPLLRASKEAAPTPALSYNNLRKMAAVARG